MKRPEMVRELQRLLKNQPYYVRYPLTFDLAYQTDQVVADRLARARRLEKSS